MTKNKFIRNVILWVTVMAVIILAGCTGRDNANMDPLTGLDPIEGGVLNLAGYTPDTLNPLCTGYTCINDYMYLVYESLFIVNEDLTVKGVLAEGYKAREGNTLFEINLKKGVKFHNGTAFNADDVVATLDYIRMYETNYSSNLDNVKTYRKKGNYAVEIVLFSPMVNFPANLDFPILLSGLQSEDFALPNKSFKPIGTGRYKYGKTNPYESLILEANRNWHSDKKVYIPEVCIRFVDGENAIAYAFDSGETDMVTTDYGRWGEFPYTVKHKTYEVTTTGYLFAGLNTVNSAFADVNLRKGIAGRIDYRHIVESLLFSHAAKADSPLSGKAYFYHQEDEESAEPDTEFTSDKLLSTYILYNEESPVKERIATYLKTVLEDAGIRVELTKVDYDTYRSKIAAGDYQVYIGHVDIRHDSNLRFIFGSAPVAVPTPEVAEEGEEQAEAEPQPVVYRTSVMCNFADPKLDDILENINSAKNDETATVAANNLRLFYKDYVPQIPLAHINEALFVSQRVIGDVNPNLTSFFADLGEVYISQKK